MDNENYRAAHRVVSDRVRALAGGTAPSAANVAIAQVNALLAIADAIDSLDDAIRNRPWEP